MRIEVRFEIAMELLQTVQSVKVSWRRVVCWKVFLQRETGRGENACNTVGFGGINTDTYPTSARQIIGRAHAPITVVWVLFI